MPDTTTSPPPLDPAFLALLCCPNCPERPRLALTPDGTGLVCPRDPRHLYPIIDGLPDLRPEAIHPSADGR